MKRQLPGLLKKFFFALLVFCSAFLITSCETTQQLETERIISPPYWAPSYENTELVHYYYLPDLEIYYDVWGSEFVYLDAGHWIFSPFLPPMYASYDLRSAPVVVLDHRVHEPWNFHELYVSHYPRYYFQTVPIGGNSERPRGLDENVNRPVFYGPRENPAGNAEPKKPLPITSTSPSMVTPSKTKRANYKGKTTGRPVKVEKRMMKPKQVKQDVSEKPKPVAEPKQAAKP